MRPSLEALKKTQNPNRHQIGMPQETPCHRQLQWGLAPRPETSLRKRYTLERPQRERCEIGIERHDEPGIEC